MSASFLLNIINLCDFLATSTQIKLCIHVFLWKLIRWLSSPNSFTNDNHDDDKGEDDAGADNDDNYYVSPHYNTSYRLGVTHNSLNIISFSSHSTTFYKAVQISSLPL